MRRLVGRALALAYAAGSAAYSVPAVMGATSQRARRKVIHLVRHGQAQHNVRAEPARAAGCSYDEFLELMRLDDAFDASLTPMGMEQAQNLARNIPPHVQESIQLVVASPLTRALHTADIVFPRDHPRRQADCPRVSLDLWREVSGLLINAQRRTRTELRQANTHWNFDCLEEQDGLWTPDRLEDTSSCAQRGYLALKWAWERPEDCIAIVAHGGILSFTLSDPGHPLLLVDPGARARFHNCEMRSYVLELAQLDSDQTTPGTATVERGGPVLRMTPLPDDAA